MPNKHFKPAWWLPNAHLQTLWSTLFRRPLQLTLRRERIELPDGDFVDLDWVGEGTGPIVFLLHGLEGSVNSPYAQGMLYAVEQRGWRGVILHFRGCSGEMNRSARGYHSGDTADLAFAIKMLHEREPNTKIAAIGYSLGANVLLKWLGETGKANPLCAAIGVSVPFEFHKTVERINRGFSRLYQWNFIRSLRRKVLKKIQHHPNLPIDARFKKIKTLREYDDAITAPLHGFANADDYYAKSSCRQFLHKITVPTLLLQAKDDPFMTHDLIPLRHELSPSVILELTEQGGHVGFITGTMPWRAEYWLEQRAPEFLRNYLSME